MKANMRDVLSKAQQHHYAVPSVNYIDWMTAKAYAEVSEKLGLPLILSFAQAHSEWLSLEEAALIGRFFQQKLTTPVVLHLDHGRDASFIQQAVALGFNSVMIDASQESFEENVRKTKEIINFAHPLGIDVEAEIGFVGANDTGEQVEVLASIYTTVDEAVRFAQATAVDTLAVSIGTAHGLYKGTPKLNFERLQAIAEAIPQPLVLHGGSSSGDDNLRRCAQEGISKINVFSDFMQGAYQYSQGDSVKGYMTLTQHMAEGVKEVLTHYYRIFGTQRQ